MSLDIEGWMRHPKIDMHCHVWNFSNEKEEQISSEQLILAGEMLGITEFWCSSPITGGRIASPEEVRQENDAVLRALKRHPEHIRGMCYVIPGHYQAALDEINRCLDEGMIGIKLYNQYRINDPAVYPVIELAIKRNVCILEHAGYLEAREHLDQQPLISHGHHFADVNKVYPEAMLIHAHIGGGGDWEHTVRAMRDTSPNLYCDVSGSNLDDGQIELAVTEMGAESVLFGTDGTMTGSVGKVIDATLTDEEKSLIFWGNAERILAAQGAKPTQPWKEVAA
ncbi:MAG: amidohydrolase family protein [bacterium]|nr:amidohydrolase family protein [bacterium]